MRKTDPHQIIDNALTAVLAIAGMARVLMDCEELDSRQRQAVATGIESVANAQIDLLVQALSGATEESQGGKQ